MSTPPPAASSLSDIRAFFRAEGKFVLTFAGYSGAGYEDSGHLFHEVEEILAERNPLRTLVNAGGTPEGIGAVYPWAKERGFTTTGIVSTLAPRSGAVISPWCDHPFFVEDPSWGGVVDGRLSPTSEAMVEVSDLMIAFGGGEIARDELEEMRRRGKPVRFVPADMNHAVAIAKAAAKGHPAPDAAFLRGAAHARFGAE